MAKFKKGSPEAKAYMASIRPGRTRKASSRGVKRMSKRSKGRKRESVFHAIPDLFYAGSALVIGGPAVSNAVGNYRNGGGGMSGLQTMVSDLPWTVSNEIIPNALPAAELAVTGIVIQKVAKWLGLNRFGTKRVKVF